jgi:hypothetical protein
VHEQFVISWMKQWNALKCLSFSAIGLQYCCDLVDAAEHTVQSLPHMLRLQIKTLALFEVLLQMLLEVLLTALTLKEPTTNRLTASA